MPLTGNLSGSVMNFISLSPMPKMETQVREKVLSIAGREWTNLCPYTTSISALLQTGRLSPIRTKFTLSSLIQRIAYLKF